MPRAKKTPNLGPKPNRVDLNQAQAAVPVVAAGSVDYGQRQQIEAAVAQAPLANDDRGYSNALAAAAAASPPPTGGLTRPSEQPNVPVTAGLNSGPGPGSEALIGARTLTRPKVSEVLEQIAAVDDSPVNALLAERARRMGI